MYKVIIVPETHWDRAWYSPFQEFRIRLVKLFDKLLGILDDGPDYKCFVFDGQTVILEDYLEVRPENEEKVRRYVQEGRIQVGPWYVLCDEFLVSGEAIVRNLLIGKKIAEDFGRRMDVGYVPDAFGHVAQLPQILSKSGIDSALFMRGMGDEGEELGSEFIWRGMDGESAVLAVHLVDSYGNASRLGYERMFGDDEKEIWSLETARKRAQRSIEKLKKYATTRFLLFNNGVDHVEPDPTLPEIIRYLNENVEGVEFVHGDYRRYVDEVRKARSNFKEAQGERRLGRYFPILPGVYSARMYLKQVNERNQTLLERYADPLAALAWNYGETHPGGILKEAWKLLLKNHPHDDICGCSVDETHRDMVNRFEQSQQIGRAIARQSLEALAKRIDTSSTEQGAIIVYNPLSWMRADVCEVKFQIPVVAARGKRPVLRTPEGEEAAYDVISERTVEVPYRGRCREYEISFIAPDIPSFGYRSFSLDVVDKPADFTEGVRANEGSLENEFLKVTVNPNGSLNVLYKETGEVYENQNLFEDSEDVGDEYNYSPAELGLRLTTEESQATSLLMENGASGATLRVDVPLRIPKRISNDRRRRVAGTTLHTISSYVSLRPGGRRVDIRTEVENRAMDHRLRALFPTSIRTRESRAEDRFCVVRRSMDHPTAEGWTEKPSPTEPQQSYVNLSNGEKSLTVVNQGVTEYEPIKGDVVSGDESGSTIALTLLRCVGWLSRGDLLTRRGNAGPQVPAPEAQCLGHHTFRYAIVPHRGSLWEAKAYRLAYEHNVRLMAVATPPHGGMLPQEKSFIQISEPSVLLSTVKRSEDSRGIVIRVFNTSPDKVRTDVGIFFPGREVYSVDLMEEKPEHLKSADGKLELSLRGYEIKTLKVL